MHGDRRHFLKLAGGAVAASWVGPRTVRGTDLAPMRILFFTDLHAMLEREAPARMRETAARMAELSFDLVIGGGDFVDGGWGATEVEMEPKFAAAKTFLSEIGHPVEAVVGNHDHVAVAPLDGSAPASDPLAMFRKLTGLERPWRVVERMGRKFFFVNSVVPVADPVRYHGRIDAEQMNWLREELARTSPDQPLVLCSHIPFRTTFKQVQEHPFAPLPPNLVVENANEVLALFAGHDLRLVLQGHLHFNEWIQINGRDFLMGGAVAGAWWRGSNLETPPGFGLVTLDAPGGFSWRYEAMG